MSVIVKKVKTVMNKVRNTYLAVRTGIRFGTILEENELYEKDKGYMDKMTDLLYYHPSFTVLAFSQELYLLYFLAYCVDSCKAGRMTVDVLLGYVDDLYSITSEKKYTCAILDYK